MCSFSCFTSVQTAAMSVLWKGANLVVPISFPIVGIYSFFLTSQAIEEILLNLLIFLQVVRHNIIAEIVEHNSTVVGVWKRVTVRQVLTVG
jgi:hypothetical protein